MVREHAFDSVLERRLFSISLESADQMPTPRDLPPRHFACLLAWNANGTTADKISSIIEPLLQAGASYFVCWGPDCERVHDTIDEIISHPDTNFGVPPDSCIMTTCHDSEQLSDALSFFLANSCPDQHYQDSTRAGLAVSIGSPQWAAEIGAALSVAFWRQPWVPRRPSAACATQLSADLLEPMQQGLRTREGRCCTPPCEIKHTLEGHLVHVHSSDLDDSA